MSNDKELQHAGELSKVLGAMREDLNDEAVERVLRWMCERHGIVTGTVLVRKRPPTKAIPIAVVTSGETVRLGPPVGATAKCASCGEAIVYIGVYWDHAGERKPRHPAIPAGGMWEER